MVENPVKHTNPVVGLLYRSWLETSMGASAPPSGGFCVFKTCSQALVNKGVGYAKEKVSQTTIKYQVGFYNR